MAEVDVYLVNTNDRSSAGYEATLSNVFSFLKTFDIPELVINVKEFKKIAGNYIVHNEYLFKKSKNNLLKIP